MQALTVQDVARILKISVATVYALCGQKKIAHVRVGVGRGAIRIREEDLAAFLAGATVQSEVSTTPKPPPIKLKHLKV